MSDWFIYTFARLKLLRVYIIINRISRKNATERFGIKVPGRSLREMWWMTADALADPDAYEEASRE